MSEGSTAAVDTAAVAKNGPGQPRTVSTQTSSLSHGAHGCSCDTVGRA